VTSPSSEYISVAARAWEQRRPGVHWKVLHEEDGRRTVLVRYDAGAVVPRHRHLGDEQIFVIEGSVTDDTGTCTAGDFARRPPGCVHTVRSPGGALVLAVMSGGTEPVPEPGRAQAAAFPREIPGSQEL
jgi:anti-sigma factor ChrR (cupin superfamily)